MVHSWKQIQLDSPRKTGWPLALGYIGTYQDRVRLFPGSSMRGVAQPASATCRRDSSRRNFAPQTSTHVAAPLQRLGVWVAPVLVGCSHPKMADKSLMSLCWDRHLPSSTHIYPVFRWHWLICLHIQSQLCVASKIQRFLRRNAGLGDWPGLCKDHLRVPPWQHPVLWPVRCRWTSFQSKPCEDSNWGRYAKSIQGMIEIEENHRVIEHQNQIGSILVWCRIPMFGGGL